MNESDSFEIYRTKASEIIKHYNILGLAVRRYLFPWKVNVLDWLPDFSNWSSTKREFFIFFMPLALLDSTHNESLSARNIPSIFIVIVGWLQYFFTLFIIALISVFLLLGYTLTSIPQANQTSPTIDATSMIYYLVIAGTFFYVQLFWYWFNKKTTWKSRVLYLASNLITSSFYFLGVQYLSASSNNLKASVVPIITSTETLIFLIILIWIPFVLLSSWVFLSLAKILFNALFELLRYFLKAHSTDYSSFINKTISEPIEISGEKLILSSLSKSELAAIKEWAKNSLESTEKKTIPTVIVTAFLAILIAYTPLQEKLSIILTALINWIVLALKQNTANPLEFSLNFIFLGATGLLVIAVIFMIKEYLGMLVNLVTQGIIIEVCTVAEYAKLELEKEIAKQNQAPSPWQTIVYWFFGR